MIVNKKSASDKKRTGLERSKSRHHCKDLTLSVGSMQNQNLDVFFYKRRDIERRAFCELIRDGTPEISSIVVTIIIIVVVFLLLLVRLRPNSNLLEHAA